MGPEDGPPAMVIPGFFASDRSTLGLQRAFAEAGFRAGGWEMGFNRGVSEDTLARIAQRLERFAGGRKALLIGWSLGGIYAREVAKARPDLVAAVITLGTPFSGNPRANNVWYLYEMWTGHKVDDPPIRADLAAKPPVPTIAFWSRQDGIVAPASARGRPGERDKAIELDCSHMGFATSSRAWPAIVEAALGAIGATVGAAPSGTTGARPG